jgi:hypothetical protein
MLHQSYSALMGTAINTVNCVPLVCVHAAMPATVFYEAMHYALLLLNIAPACS